MGAPFSPSVIDSMLKGELAEPARIVIVEEPQPRGYRFRYECEGHSHGGLQGAGSEKKNNKTYPTIMILGIEAPSAQVTVSLWTADEHPRPHVHDLIGKNCSEGRFTMDVKRESYGKVVFNSLSIRNTKKTDVVRILKDRKTKEHQGLFLPALSDEQLTQVAEAEAKELQLNVVRLKFEVTPLGDLCTGVVASALSEPVYDSKCPAASLLKICRISCSSGTCRGGTEVFMLCEKVQKDIMIRFRERETGISEAKWQDYATFSPVDIHRQYAIVFRTPPYCNQQLTDDVEVELQLYRPSDGQESPSVPFKYCADRSEQEHIARKRKRVVFDQTAASSSSFLFDQLAGIDTALGSGVIGGPAGNSGYSGVLPNISTLDVPYQAFPVVLQQDPMAGFANYSVSGLPFSQAPMTGSELVQHGDYQPVAGSASGDLLTPTLDMAEPDFDLSQDLVEMDSAPDYEVARPHVPSEVPGWNDSSYVKGWPLSSTYAAESDIFADAGTNIKRARDYRQAEPKKSGCSPLLPSDAGRSPAGVSAPTAKTASQPDAGCTTTAAANEKISATPVQRICSELTRSVHDYAASGDIRFVLAVVRGLFCEHDYNGDNVLHVAVIHENFEALRNLLEAGAEAAAIALRQTNPAGQTPLHLATVLRQARLVELLLHHSSDATALDANGNSVWHLAAYGADLATLRVLRSHVSADAARRCINRLNYEGLSALHVAVRAKATDFVKELVECGADVNVADGKSGRTALHHAVDGGDLCLTSYLMFTAGANVDQPSYDGNTPLHIAAATGNFAIAATLIAFGANTLLENGDPKECECESEACQLSDECLQHGHTPRDIACNRQIADLLDGKPIARNEVQSRSLPCHAGSTNVTHGAAGGDMARLDDGSRRSLAAMLDGKPEMWARLAALVGLSKLVPELKGASSPTQALLTGYEASDGTTADLCRCLVQLNLVEAADLVERRCLAGRSSTGATSSGHSFDSGVGTSFANHDSMRSLDSC